MDLKIKQKKHTVLKRLREELIPVLEQVISNRSVLFENPKIVKCWKVLDCKSAGCVLYRNETEPVRCWHIVGTLCGGEPQGDFVQKYGRCINCKVFKDSCPTIVEEIGELFNNLVFLLNNQNQEKIEDKQRIEHFNETLVSAVDQLKEKNGELQEMIITDSLTGLFNRQHLFTVLEDEIARCHRYDHPLAVMIIDIDDFESFNNCYGHMAGDEMLTFAGFLIKENIRKFDRAFRYVGKTFIVVLPETDSTLAHIVAERIRKGFENKTFSVIRKGSPSQESVSRKVSIGITAAFACTKNNIDAEELIDQINKSLYSAKDKGGNISVKYESFK